MFLGYIRSVAAILQLQIMGQVILFLMLNALYFYISTSRSICAVPNMAVFYSSLISCFHGMLLRYCLNDGDMVPVTPVITCFTFYTRWTSIENFLSFSLDYISVY